MFGLPSSSWYTDTCDVYRIKATVDGGLTKHEREKVVTGLHCRVYQNPTNAPSMENTAATVSNGNALACAVDADIKAGDEIIVYRASLIRSTPVSTTRYFAGTPNVYVQPFGGVCADLEHMQVALFNEERVNE